MSEVAGFDGRSLITPTMALPSYLARKRRAKLLVLGVLMLALAASAWAFANYYNTKEAPLPSVEAVEAGKIVPPTFVSIMTGGKGDLSLQKPLGVAVHPNGNVYVTSFSKSYGKGRVEVFKPDGTLVDTFDEVGKSGVLKSPMYIAINSKGRVFVSDKRHQAIFVFDEKGKFIERFQPEGKAEYAWMPLALTFDADDNLYVTDTFTTHQVLVFSPDGTLKVKFGSLAYTTKKGQFYGKFYYPNGVFVDSDKKIFVADSNNQRVQVFSPEGKFLYAVETSGLPRGVAVDDQSRLYVVDALGHNVSVYNKTSKDGQAMAIFGEQGVAFGQFLYPNGLAISKDGKRIYVTDRENNRVQVWVWPTVAAGVTPTVKAALPWAIIALLIALLTAWRLLRRRRYFASASFMREIVDDHQLYQLSAFAKRIYVHPDTYAAFKTYQEGDLLMSDVIRPLKVDTALVSSAKADHGLDDEAAALFAVAGKGWVRPRILSQDPLSHKAAFSLSMESMDYALFKGFYTKAGPA